MLVLHILTGKGRWYYAIIINIAEAIALETNQKPLETHLGKKKTTYFSLLDFVLELSATWSAPCSWDGRNTELKALLFVAYVCFVVYVCTCCIHTVVTDS